MDAMNVVMVGPDGCGKTVYLAVLFKQQFVANERNPWQLQAIKPERRQFLNRTYQQIIDPGVLFPQPTIRSDLIDYGFRVHVMGKECDITPLSLTYLDFSGERVYLSQAGETDEFSRHVEQADVVMGMFDGLDVLGMMRDGEQPPAIHLQLKYGSLLDLLATNKNQTRAPIHFVVTKWDLLQDAGYKLADVKKKLLQFQQFATFMDRTVVPVYRPGPHSTVERVYPPSYLIPMSTLGVGFTYLSDNQIVKSGKSEVSPEEITLPVALAVCDGIRVQWANGKNGEHLSSNVKNIIAALAYVIEPVVISSLPLPAQVFWRLGKVIREWWQRNEQDNRLDREWLNNYRAQYEHDYLKITDEQSALETLVSDLALQIIAFQLKYPDARLN